MPERYDPRLPMPRGLPRPVWEAPDGHLRPVPWTQRDNAWGKVDVIHGRWYAAQDDGLCLVCGEVVQEGVVFFSEPAWAASSGADVGRAKPELVTLRMLGHAWVADQGPLHERPCALMTRAHCKTVRRQLEDGVTRFVPYRRYA
jgi:hypothetical protein